MKETIHVLLIEDDPDDAFLVRESLSTSEETTFEVVGVDMLSQGLALLETKPFDVILLDLSLPDSQGIDTFIELISSRIGTPIIVLTGLYDSEMSLRMIRLGAQGYLVKGHDDLDQLPRTLQYAIEQYALARKADSVRRWTIHDKLVEQLLGLWVAEGDSIPPSLAGLTDVYSSLLIAVINAGVAWTEQLTAELPPLLDTLEKTNAGPSEVIMLHRVAVQAVHAAREFEPIDILESGYLLAAKILGDLLLRYRIHTQHTVAGA